MLSDEYSGDERLSNGCCEAVAEAWTAAGMHHVCCTRDDRCRVLPWPITSFYVHWIAISKSSHIMGLLQNSTRGLGHVSVRGLSLVPKPPTRIIAFRCADVAFVMMLAFGWMQGKSGKCGKRLTATTNAEKPVGGRTLH